MRHILLFLVVLAVGCSTQPIVNTLDFFKPGKMYPNEVEPYGGVLQQGAVLAPGPLGLPETPPIGPGVIPPPVPLPATPAGLPPPVFPVPKPGP